MTHERESQEEQEGVASATTVSHVMLGVNSHRERERTGKVKPARTPACSSIHPNITGADEALNSTHIGSLLSSVVFQQALQISMTSSNSSLEWGHSRNSNLVHLCRVKYLGFYNVALSVIMLFTSMLEITNLNDVAFNYIIRYNYVTFLLHLHHCLYMISDGDALLYII